MIARAAIVAILVSLAPPVSAQLYKCVGKDGKVAYQAEACADATQERRIKVPVAEAADAGPNGVSLIDVTQAARRISTRVGIPTVLLLYSTTCPLSRQMFPEFVAIAREYRARGVEFVVLSTDEEEQYGEVAGFLAARKAPFEPMALKRWAPGNLTRAMAPLGIEVQSTWTRPLVVVRDRNGRVVRQSQAEVDLSGLRTALDKVVH